MTSRSDIVQEVRGWIGTPWHHQGRTKGVACDCLGLVAAAAEVCGQMPEHLRNPTYSRLPTGDQMRHTFDDNMEKIAEADARAGDVVVFSLRSRNIQAGAPEPLPTHAGILTPYRHEGIGAPFGLCHAMVQLGCVSEQQYDLQRLYLTPVGYYRFRGLD